MSDDGPTLAGRALLLVGALSVAAGVLVVAGTLYAVARMTGRW